MKPPSDFQRFLAAKAPVDDRALNRHVFHRLMTALAEGHHECPLQVLEVGSGVGAMLERLVKWNLLRDACYEAIDLDPENIRESKRLVSQWSGPLGFEQGKNPDVRSFHLKRGLENITVHFEAADIYEFSARKQKKRQRDLLIAHAFLDLVDAGRVLPVLLSLMKPNGLLYLTLNFDGVTIMEPSINQTRDRQILDLYHESMDRRLVHGLPSGDSRTGRHLFAKLRENGTQVLDAGSSDWVVYPTAGRYPNDEAYFLHYIITLMETTLKGHPLLSPPLFSRWIAERHAQIEQGELVFIAHQMDFLCRVGPS